jgi:hypothetical protein
VLVPKLYFGVVFSINRSKPFLEKFLSERCVPPLVGGSDYGFSIIDGVHDGSVFLEGAFMVSFDRALRKLGIELDTSDSFSLNISVLKLLAFRSCVSFLTGITAAILELGAIGPALAEATTISNFFTVRVFILAVVSQFVLAGRGGIGLLAGLTADLANQASTRHGLLSTAAFSDVRAV